MLDCFFVWEIQVYREMINYQAREFLNYHPLYCSLKFYRML